MSYRSDHDAALARVEALEIELRQRKAECDRLRSELARPRVEVRTAAPLEPAPVDFHFRRRRSNPAAGVVFCVLALVSVAVLSVAGPRHRHHRSVVPREIHITMPTPHVPAYDPTPDLLRELEQHPRVDSTPVSTPCR